MAHCTFTSNERTKKTLLCQTSSSLYVGLFERLFITLQTDFHKILHNCLRLKM